MSRQWESIITALLVAVAMFTSPRVVQAQVRYQDLRARVFCDVDRGVIKVDEPTFDWSGDHLTYHFGQGYEISPEENPLEQPFAELLTVAAIKKYRMRNRRQRQFWSAVLPKVEEQIGRMVTLVAEQRLSSEELQKKLDESSNAISRIYQEELDALAKREGKTGAQPVAFAPALCSLSARAEPDDGTVKYMRAGAFLLHKYSHSDSPPEWADHKWQTAPSGGEFQVGQRTYFRVRWSDRVDRTHLISAPVDEKKTLVLRRTGGIRWEE